MIDLVQSRSQNPSASAEKWRWDRVGGFDFGQFTPVFDRNEQ